MSSLLYASSHLPRTLFFVVDRESNFRKLNTRGGNVLKLNTLEHYVQSFRFTFTRCCNLNIRDLCNQSFRRITNISNDSSTMDTLVQSHALRDLTEVDVVSACVCCELNIFLCVNNI